MTDIVIKVENIGKKYTIGHQAGNGRYTALRDVAMQNARKLLCKTKDMFHGRPIIRGDEMEEFWALKDITFEIRQGETVGIIGRNGAGKSTLLKILSRITDPSTGRVSIKGRVASLLEVGTGFHPELTGRENVYLNGAILGMTRAEIKKKFDEIVAFAEVEKFLDTPVKRYSSGMYVRLAFAVAAHLEPEILVVDEVLAVGDAMFQKKCLGKMGEVSKQGRTILFVSHNMAAITSLCNTALLLDQGRIVARGKTSDIVLSYYSQGLASPAFFEYSHSSNFIGDEHASLISGAVVDKSGESSSEVDIREPIRIIMKYNIISSKNKYFPNFHIFSSDGTYAFISSPQAIDVAHPGVYEAACMIPANFLNEGTYFVGLALTSLESGVKVHFFEKNALSFNVKDPIEGVPTRNGYAGPIPGVVRPLLDWAIRRV